MSKWVKFESLHNKIKSWLLWLKLVLVNPRTWIARTRFQSHKIVGGQILQSLTKSVTCIDDSFLLNWNVFRKQIFLDREISVDKIVKFWLFKFAQVEVVRSKIIDFNFHQLLKRTSGTLIQFLPKDPLNLVHNRGGDLGRSQLIFSGLILSI